MSDIIPTTLLIIGGVSVVIFIMWFVITIIDDFVKSSDKKSFKNDILDAIKNTQLSWDHIKLFASTRHLSQRDVGIILKVLLGVSWTSMKIVTVRAARAAS
jgi:hypothetical protein